MRAYTKEIPGRIHEKIEDSAYESVFLDGQGEKTGLFIIADGMSGFAGTTASHCMISYLRENIEMTLRKEEVISYENLLKDAITQGSDFLEKNDKGRSTLDVVLVSSRMIYYAHLGDSCIYSVSQKKVCIKTPLEKDKWGVPVNFVGKSTVEGDVRSIRDRIYFECEERSSPDAPDYILLATDGLLSRLTTEEITQTLEKLYQDSNPKEILDILGSLVYNPKEKIRDACTPREISSLFSLCEKKGATLDDESALESVRLCYMMQKNANLVALIDEKLRWDDTSLILIDLKNAVEKKIYQSKELRTVRIPALEREKEEYAKKLENRELDMAILQSDAKDHLEQLHLLAEEKKNFGNELGARDQTLLQKEEQIKLLEEEKKKLHDEVTRLESLPFLERLLGTKKKGTL